MADSTIAMQVCLVLLSKRGFCGEALKWTSKNRPDVFSMIFQVPRTSGLYEQPAVFFEKKKLQGIFCKEKTWSMLS